MKIWVINIQQSMMNSKYSYKTYKFYKILKTMTIIKSIIFNSLLN